MVAAITIMAPFHVPSFDRRAEAQSDISPLIGIWIGGAVAAVLGWGWGDCTICQQKCNWLAPMAEVAQLHARAHAAKDKGKGREHCAHRRGRPSRCLSLNN